MEKNLNHKNLNSTQTEDTLPATPNVDLSINYSSHPSASLHSVIKHNEDLMARLSVNLRRVGHLEKIIEDLTIRFKVERSNCDSLRDELLIHSEKNRLSESQLKKMTADLSRLQNEVNQSQINSVSLKSELKDQASKYEYKISQLELEISSLAEIKTHTEKELKPKVVNLEEKAKTMALELAQAKQRNEELKEKLLNLSHQAQSEALNFQSVSKDLQNKVKEKDLVISQLQGLDQKVKQISKEKSVLENKNIDLEHEIKRIFSSKSSELETIQTELNSKNSELNKLKIENYELKKSWAEAHSKSKDLETKNESLEEKANSMQHMWQEKNRKHIELDSQLKILENMRHELSIKIRNQDHEIKSKNKKINELLELLEKMNTKGQFDKDVILETALRGMRNLHFEEEEKPSIETMKTISF